MIRHVPRLLGIALLVASACSDPRADAPREGSLVEAIPPEDSDDGNAGEPRRAGSFSSTVTASACQPGANGGWHHCSAACPCPAGEGDCDSNDDCAPGLTCVKNIGATYGWDPDVDVCEDTCHPSANGGFHYCSESCPCTAGEGDCDSNAECMPGLTCVKDIGPIYGWDADVDVCEDTCHPSANGGFHYCSESCPCGHGEGDCDSNAECMPGLTCVKDVGPNYGWDEDVDVCEGDCDSGDTCNPGCPCEPTHASLFLQVLALDGQPIPSAAITTLDNDPQPTDGVGRIRLDDLPPGRFVARVDAYGYAPASVAVDLPAGAHTGAEVRLRPLGPPIPFQAEAGAVIQQPDARVTIPPGAIVDHLGQPVTGTVEATIVPLDPTQATPDTLPGPLQGAAGTGATVELESVVMAEVTLWHDGLPVQLAPGARATLELALPDTVSGQYEIGESIPAWWLDLDAGVWREEGAGTIQPSSTDPDQLVWVVEVGHFTWWNCDRPWTDKHCYTVTVQDSSGNPVPDVQVSAQGVSYTGASQSSYTGASGQACVEIKRDGTADILVGTASTPLATQRVTGAGPAADCAGSGGACTPVTVTLPPGTVVCTPGASVPCPYGGPPDTEGVGVCQAGTNQCNADGTAWSGCVGEVLPADETCASIFDEDCDGFADDGLDCPGCSFGQRLDCYTGPPETLGVGLCQAGWRRCLSTKVFGSCDHQVLPQPETCETPGDDDCNGSTSCAGTTLWSQRFGGTSIDVGRDVAVDSDDNVLLTGHFYGTADFGGGPLSTAGSYDIFVVKLAPQGQHLWSRRFGGTEYDTGQDIAVDSAGNVLLTGQFQGTADFGGGPLLSSGFSTDVFAVKLDAQGQHLWSRRLGGRYTDLGLGVAVDSGNVLLTGRFQGTADFGGGPLSNAGGFDVFAVKLDAQGQHLWSRRLGGTHDDYVLGVAVDSAGNVLLTGQFQGTADFGGGPLSSAGNGDIFAVKLDAQGQHLWSRRLGGTSNDYGQGIAVDSAGNVLLTGYFTGTADFGGGPLSSAGGFYDVFAVKLDTQGQHLWSRSLGGTSWNYGQGIAVDSAGNVLLSGYFYGTADFGGGPLSSAGGNDVFAVKLDAQGQHLWSRRLGGTSWNYGQGIAVDSAGNVLLSGYFEGTADFGGGPLSSAGDSDVFAVKLNP